jgi:hypothetical protein
VKRAGARRLVVIAGAVLLLGHLLAPSLPLTAAIPLTIVWFIALGYLLYVGYAILRTAMPRALAGGMVGMLAALPLLVTSVPWKPEWAMKLPCRKNWLWPPAWILRSSPTGSVVLDVAGAKVKVCYGRPAARGRTMIGGGHVPYGRLWRTGANEPTTIITPVPIAIAGVAVPAGRVSLYSIPGPESWEIIINAATSQWGIESKYTPEIAARELGRSIVRSGSADSHVERLTIVPEPLGMLLMWEKTRVLIPVEIRP